MEWTLLNTTGYGMCVASISVVPKNDAWNTSTFSTRCDGINNFRDRRTGNPIVTFRLSVPNDKLRELLENLPDPSSFVGVVLKTEGNWMTPSDQHVAFAVGDAEWLRPAEKQGYVALRIRAQGVHQTDGLARPY